MKHIEATIDVRYLARVLIEAEDDAAIDDAFERAVNKIFVAVQGELHGYDPGITANYHWEWVEDEEEVKT